MLVIKYAFVVLQIPRAFFFWHSDTPETKEKKVFYQIIYRNKQNTLIYYKE